MSKLMKQSLTLLAVFVLFQTEVKPHGIPKTLIKRGAFATFDGCKSSALVGRTLQLGEGTDPELNDGYLKTGGTEAVRLQCSRRK
jgi:hypothetical protein